MTLLPILRNVKRQFVELPGVITIDSGADDGRFLPAMRTCFPNALRHATVKEALENVAGASEATIIGHGVQAYLAAGLGTVSGHTASKHLCLPHETTDWGPVIDGIPGRTIKRLTIFACSVGAGSSGATLVSKLAARLNARVRAPLGDVWADEFTRRPCMTKTGGWQEATPDGGVPESVAAIPKLSLSTRPTNLTLPRTMMLFDQGRFLPLPLGAIHAAHWAQHAIDSEARERSWQDDAARAVAAAVSFGEPLIFGGALASVETGRLTFKYTLLGQERTRTFKVHNDRLIEDVDAPGVFYEFDLSKIA